MQKFSSQNIKPFEFSDLKGLPANKPSTFGEFKFETLDGVPFKDEQVTDSTLRSERNFAEKNNFKIDDVVKDYRGLSKQEQSDLELKIQKEVKTRCEVAYQDAYNEGIEKGLAKGKDEAFQEFQKILTTKIEDFSLVITEAQQQAESLMEKNRDEIYEFIKRFTKWIVLKEINDKVYLEGLLEKLILELNVRRNIIIKVGKANFNQMPEVIQTIEARLGQLSNVRVEIVPQIKHPGIILECENGLIDGSLEGVFQNIDKIFELMTVKHE